MTLVLLRVDERLIHGQVVLGWGHELRPDAYVVVDDEIAESEWEQDLYRLGASGADVYFLSVAEARERFQGLADGERRIILLTRDVTTMRRIADGGLLEGRSVNIGGIHHLPGRTEVLTYVFLADEDRQDLRALTEAGAVVSARDLPETTAVPVEQLVGS